MQKVAISGDQIMADFMTRWFSGINMRVWLKVFSKEEIVQVLEEEYKNTLDAFGNFFKQIQMQDLGAYLELKKRFDQMFEVNKEELLKLYKPTIEV